jgi:hypothetical protein
MLMTLPVVAAVVVVRLLLEQVWGIAGWVDFSDVSAVLAATAFLIGFMLAGTMSDYKESEKLPAELVATLDTFEDLIALSTVRPGFDAAAARRGVLAIGLAVRDWLCSRAPLARVHEALDAMVTHFQAMDLTGSTAHANRSAVFMNAVRRLVGRIDVITRTGFLATGYAILEVMVAAVLLLLVASRFKSMAAEYTLIVCITMIYVYMLLLIRDIDNPFEYGGTLERRGAAEIEMFPLTEFIARAEARLGAAGAAK